MNNEQFGRALGLVILLVGCFLAPYLIVSFITLDMDPFDWSGLDRAVYCIGVIWMLMAWAHAKRG